MDRAPDEIIIHILKYLNPQDIARVQAVSNRLRDIARDPNLWKHICFDNSRAEANRRRQDLLARQDARLVTLREAIAGNHASSSGSAVSNFTVSSKPRASASWDVHHRDDKVDFYNEYIQRHATISLRFLDPVRGCTGNQEQRLESLGAAILHDLSAESQRLLSPLEDGSLCIYDIGSPARGTWRKPKLTHRTASDFLWTSDQHSKASQVETEITDKVVIDHASNKAYVAAGRSLSEIDLRVMTVTRVNHFPGDITALSSILNGQPMTIATQQALHLFDPREVRTPEPRSNTARLELIAGPRTIPTNPRTTYSVAPANLSQPGAMSIAHGITPTTADSIYVAGRFTSILHYDRRVFPRIQNTLFSGARLSSLAVLTHPYTPPIQSLSLSTLSAGKLSHGPTLLAAGEYKGKGSLELYDVSPSLHDSVSHAREDRFYRNRQTAATSRLLSAAPHGTRIVYSDGDGNLKWVERDGVSPVRVFNINTDGDAASRVGGVHSVPLGGGLFPGSASRHADSPDDIVRKIIPRPPPVQSAASDGVLARDDLVIWTGDGRLGLVGFGSQGDDDEAEGSLHDAAEDAHERAREREERAYGLRMREVLEAQANAARFMPGLGGGFG